MSDRIVCNFFSNNKIVKTYDDLDRNLSELEFCNCVETCFHQNVKITKIEFDGIEYDYGHAKHMLKLFALNGNFQAIIILQHYFKVFTSKDENGQYIFTE